MKEERQGMEKPILFNMDMVQAVLDGTKTVTRRVVKLKYDNTHHQMKTDKYGTRLIEIQNDVEGETWGRNPDGGTWHKLLGYIEPQPPYKKRDIMYVRETWCNINRDGTEPDYYYFADRRICEDYDESEWVWRPSIHMPKDAARIWLKVTNVAVERLHDMTLNDFLSEGVVLRPEAFNDPDNAYLQAREIFKGIWDSTVPKKQLARYGWDANPWVWAVKFERCVKPEAGEGA